MRKKRWLFLFGTMIFIVACSCGLLPSVQGLQNAATTALPALQTAVSTDLPALQTAAASAMPALLTSVPTAQDMLETLAASSNPCTGTPTAGGLGISLNTTRTVLQMTQQFAIADGSANGQPAAIVTLTQAGASSFPAIAQGFNAQFIGSDCNLSRISISIPRTDQQDTADQGVSVVNIILAGTLPADIQFPFLTWVATNYPSVPVAGQQKTIIKTYQFTLQRDQTKMLLDIVPAP
jgi:hypothetical protein